MYLIFAKEKNKNNEFEEQFEVLDKERAGLLDTYVDCFSESLLGELLPERPEDHVIDILPRSRLPNRPPYRVSVAQQEEIMSQVDDLLEKGLIPPSSSPYCSPELLVQEWDGSWLT